MAKKFMFACFGLLALALAFHLGADYGAASIVDHSTSGIVAANSQSVLLDNGEIWHWATGIWHQREPEAVPVPVSQIKFWDNILFVTTSNELWGFSVDSEHGGWCNLGSPPSNPTAVQPSTWGQIKAQLGK